MAKVQIEKFEDGLLSSLRNRRGTAASVASTLGRALELTTDDPVRVVARALNTYEVRADLMGGDGQVHTPDVLVWRVRGI